MAFHDGWPYMLPVAVGERFDGRHEHLRMKERLACHPAEKMYATLCMILGDVLEWFPELRVVLLEANCSWIPYWLWRKDEHWEHRKQVVKDKLPVPPSEYFKRQCFALIEAEETMAKYAIDWMGDEQWVFSTDSPHEDCRYPDGVATLLSQPFPGESKRKIIWDNCARLYGIS